MSGVGYAPSLNDLGSMAADGAWGIVVSWAVGGAVILITTALWIVTLAIFLTVENNKIRNYCLVICSMAFVYGWSSYFALYFLKADVVFEAVEDVYEAVCLLAYALLLIRLAGGQSALLEKLHDFGERKYIATFPCCCLLCCVHPHHYGKNLIRFNKFGVMQLIVVRIIFGVLSVFLAINGWYEEGQISFDEGYFYMKIIDGVCLFFCLWALFILYKAVHHVHDGSHITQKFLAIKIVIIVIFVQQAIFSILVKSNGIPSSSETWPSAVRAQAWNNVAIVIESPLMAIFFLIAYRRSDAIQGIQEKHDRKERRGKKQAKKFAEKEAKKNAKLAKKAEKKKLKDDTSIVGVGGDVEMQQLGGSSASAEDDPPQNGELPSEEESTSTEEEV